MKKSWLGNIWRKLLKIPIGHSNNEVKNHFSSLIYLEFLTKKSKFWPIIEILVENRNFGQKSKFGRKSKLWSKSKFWSKIEILVENRKFGRKSKVLSNIESLVENRKFGRKSKLWSKIKILVTNRNFGQKSKFGSKIEICVKNRYFWSKIEMFVENRNFGRKSKFWSKIEFFKAKFWLNNVLVLISVENGVDMIKMRLSYFFCLQNRIFLYFLEHRKRGAALWGSGLPPAPTRPILE